MLKSASFLQSMPVIPVQLPFSSFPMDPSMESINVNVKFIFSLTSSSISNMYPLQVYIGTIWYLLITLLDTKDMIFLEHATIPSLVDPSASGPRFESLVDISQFFQVLLLKYIAIYCIVIRRNQEEAWFESYLNKNMSFYYIRIQMLLICWLQKEKSLWQWNHLVVSDESALRGNCDLELNSGQVWPPLPDIAELSGPIVLI